ncbi:30S ribosome-binding factor RbfA [Treponema phagedenis]|uniref:Ribosome-binding factor A n=1 Tax=Treponema phagedenis TaxID=162 RepID=A0A0B7H1K7_TREPH|nr:30S ribosome-binding factor RbfA [Treponema phagedenis]EFW37084.1 ribosome-binding factor A [Treponema phagedenis F0421]NVP25271.1 30S ribosome-binding factor RbfA [Treponema phagedenis]QEJ93981.1 30S ribosome-binding factor RbfA [Treponema phagedenis]QEJ97051.1 30S ribosome-binding factor RbfA [Treponema phagedenis]QEK02011.1 30S ribosome-binding factor RbfA [Treponema phagedenis]
MSEFRLTKLGEQIREEISKMISSGTIKDPRVSNFLSINRVDVSADLAYAKVYVSSFMDSHKTKQGVSGLENAAGFIRTTLAKKLHVHKFPQLSFIYDESIKEGFDMVKKLDSMDISPEEEQDEEN